ncbi:MAG: stage III sporulation protein AB [Clostridia bacterium]|nr:stage III sporulation protein AB [Clostridia bacterium]
MILKWIGAGILLLSAVGYGWVKIREERRRAAQTEAAQAMIGEIREQIAYFMKPLPEIFAAYRHPVLEECGFLPLCRQENLRAAWEKAPLCLPEKLMKVTQDFVGHIGGGYREDVLRICDYTLEQYEKVIREMHSELKNREKLYRTIPPLLAVSVLLLLI